MLKSMTFEDVMSLMRNQLADTESAAGLYSLVYHAMKTEAENEVAQLVHSAFVDGLNSGTIRTSAQANAYIDALARILHLPDEADGALSSIQAYLNTLETVLDRLFEEVLQKTAAESPFAWERVQRDIDAAHDIYCVYLDLIKEEFADYKARITAD